MNISLETSHERQNKRGNTKDYFEKENKKFYTELIEGFKECAKLFPKRIVSLNAAVPVEDLHSQILKAIHHEL